MEGWRIYQLFLCSIRPGKLWRSPIEREHTQQHFSLASRESSLPTSLCFLFPKHSSFPYALLCITIFKAIIQIRGCLRICHWESGVSFDIPCLGLPREVPVSQGVIPFYSYIARAVSAWHSCTHLCSSTFFYLISPVSLVSYSPNI